MSESLTDYSVSREISYMSILSGVFPGYINSIIANSDTRAAATAIYSEFTGGIPPPWFSTLPRDVKSFLVLDFISKYRRDRDMTFSVLGEIATTLRGSASPGSAPTTVPAPTSTSDSATPLDVNNVYDQAPAQDSRRTAVIVGSVVSCTCVLAVLLVLVLIWLRRKRRAQNYNATPLYPNEPEGGDPVGCCETSEHLPVRKESQYQQARPVDLPELDMSPAFSGDLRVLKRRSRSATDLRGWTSWPGLGHEEVPELPPRSASAMSVRIVRPDE